MWNFIDRHLYTAIYIAGFAIASEIGILGYQEVIHELSLCLAETGNTTLANSIIRTLESETLLLNQGTVQYTYETDDAANITTRVPHELTLAALLHGSNAHRMDVYSSSGEIVYSSHREHIGRRVKNNPQFDAAIEGKVTSWHDRPALDIHATSSKEHSHVVTFVPVNGSGTQSPVKAVLALHAIANPQAIPFAPTRTLIGAAFATVPITLLGAAWAVYQRRRHDTPATAIDQNALSASAEASRCQTITFQEAERKRISRELHDGISQYLNAVKLHIEHIISDSRTDLPTQTRSEIQSLSSILACAIDETRRISLALRPTMLDDLGLLATLSWLCREYAAVHPTITVDKQIDLDEADIPDKLKITLYRIVQESLSNVAKHSQATRICITLATAAGQQGPELWLTVEDNGRGFVPGQHHSNTLDGSGLGLASMRERAETDGGSLTVDSQPQAGTRITASWPLASDTADNNNH